jgi:hypothetical protein
MIGEARLQRFELASRFVEQLLLDVEVDFADLFERHVFHSESVAETFDAEERLVRFFREDRRFELRRAEQIVLRLRREHLIERVFVDVGQQRQLFDRRQFLDQFRLGLRLERQLLDDRFGLRLGLFELRGSGQVFELRHRQLGLGLRFELEQRFGLQLRLWSELDRRLRFEIELHLHGRVEIEAHLLAVADRELVERDRRVGDERKRGRSGRHCFERLAAREELVADRADGVALAAIFEHRGVRLRSSARAFDVALFEQDAEQPLVRRQVRRRAFEDGAQMLGRLLREAVLREDLGLGEMFGDEVEIVARFREILRGDLHRGREMRRWRMRRRGWRRRAARDADRRQVELDRRTAVEVERQLRIDFLRGIERRHRLFDLHGRQIDRRRASAARRHRVEAAHLRADELQLVAMLRVLRLALDELLEHFRRFVETHPRDVRLGEAAHRRQDVRLFVEPRVDGDEAFERRRMARLDAQDAVQHLDGAGAFAAAEGFLGERRDHLESFVASFCLR